MTVSCRDNFLEVVSLGGRSAGISFKGPYCLLLTLAQDRSRLLSLTFIYIYIYIDLESKRERETYIVTDV